MSSFHYAAGEHQKDDIVIEVRERKWWRNDLEVGRSLFAFLRGSCHNHLSWSVYKLQLESVDHNLQVTKGILLCLPDVATLTDALRGHLLRSMLCASCAQWQCIAAGKSGSVSGRAKAAGCDETQGTFAGRQKSTW